MSLYKWLYNLIFRRTPSLLFGHFVKHCLRGLQLIANLNISQIQNHSRSCHYNSRSVLTLSFPHSECTDLSKSNSRRSCKILGGSSLGSIFLAPAMFSFALMEYIIRTSPKPCFFLFLNTLVRCHFALHAL